MHSRPDKRESETERKEIHRNKEKREAWEMNEERDKGKWEERN
jgi:ribosomal protein S10